MKYWVVVSVSLLFWFGDGKGLLAGGPEIPEPMVFDLVRGLGAQKGEIEINVLGQVALKEQEIGLAWAPEIEYAFRDGLALELEIPIVGTTVKALKAALQGTIGVAAEGRFIHGWQAIAEFFLKDSEIELAGLYLFGYRFHPSISFFCMVGVEGSYIIEKQTPTVKGILNPSLFFELTRHMIFGLETNLSYGNLDGFAALVMPQLHFRFGRVVAVQIGLGMAYEAQKFAPVLAFRIVAQERLIDEQTPTKEAEKASEPPTSQPLPTSRTRPTPRH